MVPLPQIDHTYARLKDSRIFSTFDLRSGYHHMELSPEARAKSAFVTPLDKFEFTRCPFGCIAGHQEIPEINRAADKKGTIRSLSQRISAGPVAWRN